MEDLVKCSSCGAPCDTGTANSYHDSISAHESYRALTEDVLPLSNKFQALTTPSVDFMAKLKVSHIVKLLFHRRRTKKLTFKGFVGFLIIAVLVYLQLSIGVFQRYFLERDFRMEFSYPLNIQDFRDVVESCINRSGDVSSPLHSNYSKVPFLQSAEKIQRNESIGLLIIVKSATKNYKKRMAIRRTWGDPQYLKNNVLMPGFPTQLAFICGCPKEEFVISDLFLAEKHFNDIVLAQFHDCYENNTFKTVLAMRYALEHVKSFKYLMIVDDDMYVNLENAMSLLKNMSAIQVQAVTSRDSGVVAFYPVSQRKEVCCESVNVSLAAKPILMGNLIVDAKPFRSSVGLGSKWAISIEDYPFNYFPPYIAGGVTLFDSSTVRHIYCGSFYTKHFWIDDVYIGIIAHKLGITLTNNALLDSSYRTFHHSFAVQLKDMIAVHGLQCPEQLIELWHSRDLEALADCYYLKGII